jgi:hypothetical protein
MRAKFWKISLVFFVCFTARLSALAPFSGDELSEPPSPARLAEIEHVAAMNGWGLLVPGLHTLAFHAYEHDSQAAEDWWLLSRWATVFATSDDKFMAQWVDAIKAAQAGNSDMPTRYVVHKRPLSDHVSPALQAWLLANPDFSAQFFSLLSPYDLLPKSFDILSQLQARYPEKFPIYANLALAIAMVYDVPPPPTWPHAQVSASALPRTLPDPAAAFAFWVHADETGQTLQPLSRLPASELKFVVDAAAPAAELEWAQHHVSAPLASFAGVYNLVHYRVDRAQQETYVWPDAHYDLPTILAKGGICVDQAYFACEVGKAKGVPTLLFAGAGHDAWHAWFGYLDQNGHWQLDAGRNAEVTGLAIDPQTWEYISDHELKFLSEGFRLRPSWRQACLNADFAKDYLTVGQFAAAASAARVAVNYEPRHILAWQYLLAAKKQLGAGPADIEATLREAALAFKNYPDVEAPIVHDIAASMRARGENSAADFVESQFAQKVAPERGDLALDQLAGKISQSMAADSMETQLRTYYAVLKAYGHGAGMDFFSRIVRPFVEHLQAADRKQDAINAALAAQGALHIDPNSQLDQQMQDLLTQLKSN